MTAAPLTALALELAELVNEARALAAEVKALDIDPDLDVPADDADPYGDEVFGAWVPADQHDRLVAQLTSETETVQEQLDRALEDLAVARSNYDDHIAAEVERDDEERARTVTGPLFELLDETMTEVSSDPADPRWLLVDRLRALVDRHGLPRPKPEPEPVRPPAAVPKRKRTSRKGVRS